MPATKPVAVGDLELDRKNFRTLPQKTEADAVRALIAIEPDWFWALMSSLLEDGYLPTENVIVLKQGSKLVVKEGNRRIGALKLALGHHRKAGIEIPSDLSQKITKIDEAWRQANKAVPCTVYEEDEAEIVDRVVSLTHGKGEKAGRVKWNAVARARHNRKPLGKGKGSNEPTLDFLEEYLNNGRNLNADQAQRWSGDYPLSVLEEALKRIAKRVGLSTMRDLVAAYPGDTKLRGPLEKIAFDIGLEQLRFDQIRGEDFGAEYGIANPAATSAAESATARPGAKTGKPDENEREDEGTSAKGSKARGAAKAMATADPKSVRRQLRHLEIRGRGREKVVDLRDEAVKLDIEKTPLAFCFVLRSMFELSAKAYCADHKSAGGPKPVDAAGKDVALADLLKAIKKHLTQNDTDREMQNRLHGAMTELMTANSVLSVKSMHQLIHNSNFSVEPASIARRFANVFPLLEEMNK